MRERSRVLEETNCCDSGSAACKALGGVFKGDPADCNDGNFDSMAGLSESREPLRLTEDGFGRRGKDRAEEYVILSLIHI